MAKKKKIVIDLERYGLSGPGLLRDSKVRDQVRQWFEDVLDERTIYKMKFSEFKNMGLPRIFNVNDPQPKIIDSMSFLNGERKHILWGKHHYEEDEPILDTNKLIDGENYWVMEQEDGEWVKFEVGGFISNNGSLLFIGEGGTKLLPSTVYDFGHVEDQVSERKQPLPGSNTDNFNHGDYYWVQVSEEGKWEMAKLNSICGRGSYQFELVDSLTIVDFRRVHDYKLIEKPE